MTKSTSKQAAKKKAEREPSELAREHTVAAVKRLKELMDSGNETVAVAAAKALLDRGWGKPVELIDQTTRPGEADAASHKPDTSALMARLRQPRSDGIAIESTPEAQEPASAEKQGPNKPNGTGEPCKAGTKPEKGSLPSTDATDSSQP